MKTIAAIGMIGWVGFLCGYRAAADDSRGAQAAPALPPLTEAEYSQCRSWYQEVGFESLAKMPFVRVATGASYSSNGKDEQNTYLIGFLADEAARDDGKDFAILTLDRNRCRFTRSKPDERESRRVGFERVPFNTWLHEFLAAPADESGKVTNLSSVSPFANTYPTTPAVTACHLAMLCDDLGLHEEAVKIMADIPSRLTVDEGKGKPVAERLQQEFGHVLIWQAMIDCDNPANPRSELLKRFERIIKHCPKSRHVEMAQGFATLLKRMIAEDAAHAAARAAKPFDALGREDQIKDLIFQLRDQDGVQCMQPGSCSIFGFWQRTEHSPAQRLAQIGFEAVPYLIDAMQDDSLTYSVEYHRDFYFSHRVLRVGEAAQQVIEKITGMNLRPESEIRVFGSDPKPFSPGQETKDLQAAARKWWRMFQAKGERQFLIEEVSAGGGSVGALVPVLIEKYPGDARAALEAGLKNAAEEWNHRQLVSAVGNAGFEGSDAVLRGVVKRNRFGEGTLAAIQLLHNRGAKDAFDMAIALLDEGKSWKKGGWMDKMPAEDIIEYLLEFAGARGMRAVLVRLDKLPLTLRIDVTIDLSRILGSEDGPDEATRSVAEEILVRLLEDHRRRTGTGGGIGDRHFSDPRPCDMAAEVLRARWDARYEFDYDSPLKIRDRQCLIAANHWRTAHGEQLLASCERVVKPMSTQEFDTLGKQFAQMNSKNEETAFCQAVITAGVATIPRLLELEQHSDGRKKVVAGEVIRSLANRIERIQIVPEGRQYAPVRKWQSRMLGQPLSGESVAGLMADFYKKATKNGESVRGIEFEASRDSDLTGVEVRIELTAKERPNDPIDQWDGSEIVELNGEQVHRAGYGGMPSKDDPKESAELAAGVDKAAASDARLPYEVRWEAIGWWHDHK